MSSSLWPNELQYAWLPCPSLSPRVCSDSCSLSRWCHPIISSSIIPFSSYLQSFPASLSFRVNWLFASSGQSFEAPVNIQSWFPLGLTYLISLQSTGLSRVFSSTTFESINSSVLSLLMVQLLYLYMTTEKSIALTIWTFAGKVMSLLFNSCLDLS